MLIQLQQITKQQGKNEKREEILSDETCLLASLSSQRKQKQKTETSTILNAFQEGFRARERL